MLTVNTGDHFVQTQVGEFFKNFFAAAGAQSLRVDRSLVVGVLGTFNQRFTVTLNQTAGTFPPNMVVKLFQRHYRRITLLRGTRKLFDFAVYLVGRDGFNSQTHCSTGRTRKRKRVSRKSRQTGFAELVGALG